MKGLHESVLVTTDGSRIQTVKGHRINGKKRINEELLYGISSSVKEHLT
jgi:hypothetical protein